MAEELTKHLQNELKKQLLRLGNRILQETKNYLLHIVAFFVVVFFLYYKNV